VKIEEEGKSNRKGKEWEIKDGTKLEMPLLERPKERREV